MLDPLNLPDRSQEPKTPRIVELFEDYWGNLSNEETLKLFLEFNGGEDIMWLLTEKAKEDFESYVYESWRRGL